MQTLQGLAERRLGRGAGEAGGLPIQRILIAHPVGRRRHGLAVGGQGFLVLAGVLEDVTLESEQIRPARGLGEGLGDPALRLLRLLAPQGGDGEVGVRQRIAGNQRQEPAEHLVGLGRLLVFELRQAEIA